jgi:ABC-type transport system substrate-binding protein
VVIYISIVQIILSVALIALVLVQCATPAGRRLRRRRRWQHTRRGIDRLFNITIGVSVVLRRPLLNAVVGGLALCLRRWARAAGAAGRTAMIRNIRLQVVSPPPGSACSALLVSQARELVTILVLPGRHSHRGVAGTPQFLNPLLSQYNQVDRGLTALLFDGLTRFDQQGGLEPRLARDLHLRGRLAHTFKLRPGVQWADGRPFTADDVVFTTGLLRDPGYNGPADVAALWRTVTVTRVNELEVQFALPEVYAPFLDYTTIGIVPEHLLKGVTAAGLLAHPFNQQPVGTGEFMLDGENSLRLVNGRIEQLLLQANPYFWNRQRQVKLSKVELKFYPDDTSVLAAYEAGEVQGVARVLPADLPRARRAQQLNLFTSRLSGYTLILLNTDNIEVPYLSEAAVRQALLLGIDRQALIDGVLNGSIGRQPDPARDLTTRRRSATSPTCPGPRDPRQRRLDARRGGQRPGGDRTGDQRCRPTCARTTGWLWPSPCW